MVSVERVYNPKFGAPVTVSDARVFADTFDGKRPPIGHALEFTAIGIPDGWAPWGNLTADIQYANFFQIPSILFWEQILTPAFPLRVMDGSIENLDYRLIRRKLLTVDMGEIMRESHVSDVTNIVFLSPDSGWLVQPVISEDLYKPVALIQHEMNRISESKKPSHAMNKRLGMKHTVLYLFGGEL